ncbi:IclR family transcriptional regulator [Mesorhizobium sp. CO1-1-8]|uniref:IclR family transcriptional regulator n=1 Tax=Mesorhizobium sp. CO1-1-8 TaxID=2876631 RepID=UPI001CD122B5|nr:IclR family transcriptional regulator [Mesorhizobium sp. CO1-1-8]MBZ9772403.1 IclR family transcriptional regulator [Mesorhizobium sp. CO1-1-8]
MKPDGRGVHSIEIGARLLFALVVEGEPMMLKDLARQAGIAPSQAHAYLVSFRKLGLIEQEAVAGRYRLGPFALDLAISRMGRFDIARMAHEQALKLASATAMTVIVLTWGSFGPTVIQVHESRDQFNINTRLGSVYSVTGTASGRVFAAFMAKGLIRDFIRNERKQENPSRRIGSPQFLSKETLSEIRCNGFATIASQPAPSLGALAAPVFDHVGQMRLAISLVGPGKWLGTSIGSPCVEALLMATHALSYQLGYDVQHSKPVVCQTSGRKVLKPV